MSIPFTILSILLLVNAINLSDGINSLAMIIIIYFSLYLYFNTLDQNKYLIINLIISLTILSYLNFKGNFFLGNSGSYQLGMLISLSIISSYNSKLDQGIMTNSEELFIILILPGLDMFRIFIERLIKEFVSFCVGLPCGNNPRSPGYLASIYTSFIICNKYTQTK